jgi:hypothetical protein
MWHSYANNTEASFWTHPLPKISYIDGDKRGATSRP